MNDALFSVEDLVVLVSGVSREDWKGYSPRVCGAGRAGSDYWS